jgi:tetratricopeptide (TPR) repeat protein
MGRARQAMGNMDKAIQDFKRAAALNPNYDLPRQALAQLGVAAP